MLDVFERGRSITNQSLYRELVNGVSTVLRSLNNGDRVSIEREGGREGKRVRGERERRGKRG